MKAPHLCIQVILHPVDPTRFMGNPARCVELQQALAVLKGASDEEVEYVGGLYGVLRPLRKLCAALPDRLDLLQVEHAPDLLPPTPTPRCPVVPGSPLAPAAPLHGDKVATRVARLACAALLSL